jgi:hypothetical protein
MVEQAVPMLTNRNIDVVFCGPSLDKDSNDDMYCSYSLISSYASIQEREQIGFALYLSEEWKKGPGVGIASFYEFYNSFVLEVDEATIEGLRGTNTI